mmetsp:Transcript_18730/g.21478  ORF Transcript_18730/g.21478 Transcript_18730/m.21478 type:complete len:319 (-) Transcript_18730:72-1028(-)|eukprot:CAMPEP_0194143442 /NCGR_PEP_ID=MMETSP0152-20130528/12626_1 /TAXON_ID=1049557 /ORGANISM="Thalassiothrix antarctica, Strain L6-D1" /LENGTH=318 /DNA_ID=CAMNT_0038842865 /DNA_START=34 /DNA_END=990 /DNA_ORIENTATION=+
MFYILSFLTLSAITNAFSGVSLRQHFLYHHNIAPSSLLLQQASSEAESPPAKKLICTFDADDFALPTGDWPYTDADMGRLDTSDDSLFYEESRFVKHIDDRAIDALTNFYKNEFSSVAKGETTTSHDLSILDLCSSWISHLPSGVIDGSGRIVGIGMNEKELAANKQLTEYYVQDLNKNPTLHQFEDNSFDAICNVVSVDYLTKPREVFQEIHRLLKPNGIALMSFSNRCFATKAIAMWLQADDIGRLTMLASYFHYTAEWSSIEALDIMPAKLEAPTSPKLGDMLKDPNKALAWMNTAAAVQKSNNGDPMFVVKAVK